MKKVCFIYTSFTEINREMLVYILIYIYLLQKEMYRHFVDKNDVFNVMCESVFGGRGRRR